MLETRPNSGMSAVGQAQLSNAAQSTPNLSKIRRNTPSQITPDRQKYSEAMNGSSTSPSGKKIVKKTNRAPLLIGLCSVAGLLIGATSSQAEMNQCLNDAQPSSQCLTQNPTTKRIEGMSMGLFAGAGAAVAATWRMKTSP